LICRPNTGFNLEWAEPDVRTPVEWDEFLSESERLFRHCCELDRANPENSAEKSQAVREWWALTSDILWRYVRTKAQRDVYLEPFPLEVLTRLANLAEDLGGGNVSDFVSHAAIKGKGRPYWRAERHALGYAVLYIQAADQGDIDDPHPRKTVRNTYNVTAQTVRNWLTRRDELCRGCPGKNFTPEKLQKRMEHEGALYARIGRGAPSE
jgi:hypothetical protein